MVSNMIKKIMRLLGYKVFTNTEYEQLTNAIANCGIYYRYLVGDDNKYHHGTRTVTSLFCCGLWRIHALGRPAERSEAYKNALLYELFRRIYAHLFTCANS